MTLFYQLAEGARLLASAAHGDEGGEVPFWVAANRGGVMFYTLIVFGLLLVILWKFAWGPILKALEAREKKIEDALAAADKAREEAARLTAENRDIVNRAHEEAAAVIADTKTAAEKMRHTIYDRGRKEAEMAVERARREIELEKDRVLDALRREMADITLEAASKVIEKTLDTEDHRRLAENAIEELEKMKN